MVDALLFFVYLPVWDEKCIDYVFVIGVRNKKGAGRTRQGVPVPHEVGKYIYPNNKNFE